MKRNIFTIILAISVCIMLFAGTFVLAKNKELSSDDFLVKYKNSDDKELKKVLKSMNNNELIDEMDILTNVVNESDLLVFVLELEERKDTYSTEELFEMINSSELSTTTKSVLIEILLSKDSKSTEKNLKALLKDKSIEQELKSKIIARTKADKSDVDILIQLTEENEGILAFHALKELTSVDEEKAFELAKTYLKINSKVSDYKKSASQKVMVKYIRKHGSTEEKEAFIESLFTVINNAKSSDILVDSSIFALSDLSSKKAVSAMLENKMILGEFKAFAVDQNFFLLLEAVTVESPLQEDIDTFITAMEFLPIIEGKEALQLLLKNSDDETSKRIEKAIASIDMDGILATQKWIID